MICEVPIIVNSRLEPLPCKGRLKLSQRLGWDLLICQSCGAFYAIGQTDPEQSKKIVLHETNPIHEGSPGPAYAGVDCAG